MAIQSFPSVTPNQVLDMRQLLNQVEVRDRLSNLEFESVRLAISFLAVPEFAGVWSLTELGEGHVFKIQKHVSILEKTGCGIAQSKLYDKIISFHRSDRMKTILNWLIAKTK